MALNENDATTAIDECLYLIDNNWYAYDFSQETFDHFTDYVLEAPVEKTMWGTERVQGHIDLYEVIQSLFGKYGVENADCSEELAVLVVEREIESQRLQEEVELEIDTLKELTHP